MNTQEKPTRGLSEIQKRILKRLEEHGMLVRYKKTEKYPGFVRQNETDAEVDKELVEEHAEQK